MYLLGIWTHRRQLAFKIVVPFNTERILGWYSLYVIELFMGISYSWCMLATTSYFISGCFYIDAICENFDALIDSIKEDMQLKVEPKGSQSNESPKKTENHAKLKDKLRKAVEINVKSYE